MKKVAILLAPLLVSACASIPEDPEYRQLLRAEAEAYKQACINGGGQVWENRSPVRSIRDVDCVTRNEMRRRVSAAVGF